MYWMPLPTTDLQEFADRELEFQDSVAITRRLLGILKEVEILMGEDEINWEFGDEPGGNGHMTLLLPGVGGFLAEHGDRATVAG